MKMKKRLLGILLSLALVLGMIPGMSLTAYAEDTYTVRIINGGSVKWTNANCKLNEEIRVTANNSLGFSYFISFNSMNHTNIVSSASYDGSTIIFTVNGVGTNGHIKGNYNKATGGSPSYDLIVECYKNVSSVTLNTAAEQVTCGEAVMLTATVLPEGASDRKVKWSASGTDGAAVKLYSDADCKNEVGTGATSTLTVYAKGIAAGSATVTVTSNADGSKSATYAVTITAVPVTSVTLNADSTTIAVNGVVALTATVSPDNATDKKVIWSVGAVQTRALRRVGAAVKLYKDAACTEGNEVGTEATDTLTVYAKGVELGEATVTVTSNENSNRYAICTVSVQDIPHTGDTADFGLWASLLLAGLAGMGIALTMGKRRKARQ